MAQVPYTGGVPEVAPDARPSDDYQRINADAGSFGAAIGEGLKQFGGGASHLASFWGKVQTDGELNNAQRDSHNLVEEFKKLRGADALTQQEAYTKQIDEVVKRGRDNLVTAEQQLQYDNSMRPFRERYLAGQMTTHAVTQGYAHVTKVNTDTISNSLTMIPSVADQPEEVKHLIGDAVNASVKQAHAQYGDTADPAIIRAATKATTEVAYKTWIDAVAVDNPAKARELTEDYKKELGAHYPQVASALRARSDQIEGRQGADEEMGRDPATQGRTQQIMRKAEAAGYSPIAQAAIAGHLYHESGNNPNAVHDGGIGLGIAGWNKERLDALKSFAASRGKRVNDFDTQVDFALHELQNGTDFGARRADRELRNAKTLDEAVTAFMHFERPQGYTPDNPRAGDSFGARLSNAAKFANGNFSVLPDKASTFERIVARYPNDPGKQNAALSWANHVYTIYNGEQAQARAQFKTRVHDNASEAINTGGVQQPIPLSDFVENFGPENGPKAYADHQQTVQLGTDMAGLSTMSTQERSDLLRKYQPQPGEGFAAQASRQGELFKAQQRIFGPQGEATRDPGLFAMTRLPAVKDAYTQMNAVMGDQKANEAQRLAASAKFVNVTLAEQERVGIPPEARAVLPQDVASRMVMDIMKPLAGTKGEQSSADIAGNIELQAKLWGDNWPLVYKQIQKDALPVVRVIGSGVAPTAARILTELAPLKLPDILKDENAERASQIKKDVLDAFKPFAASMVGSEDRLAIFNDFRSQAEKLAAYYVVGGKDSSVAADLAFKDLLGAKYHFPNAGRWFGAAGEGTYRYPKSEPYPLSDIEVGAQQARGRLGEMGLLPARDTIGGLSARYLADAPVKAYQSDGVWVTAPGDSGLMLVYNDEAVRTKNGQPLTLTWKQIAEMGQAAVKQWSGTGGPDAAALEGWGRP